MKRASALRLLGILIIIGATILTILTILLYDPALVSTIIAALALRPESPHPAMLAAVVDVMSPADEALLASLLGV
jgi:hypothetical protein